MGETNKAAGASNFKMGGSKKGVHKDGKEKNKRERHAGKTAGGSEQSPRKLKEKRMLDRKGRGYVRNMVARSTVQKGESAQDKADPSQKKGPSYVATLAGARGEER